MERLCRLCLQSASDLEPIAIGEHNIHSSDASIGHSLVQLIIQYLSIQIIKVENECPFICPGCKSLVEEWHRFHTSCVKNNEIYQRRVQEKEDHDKADSVHHNLEESSELEQIDIKSFKPVEEDEENDPDFDPNGLSDNEDDDDDGGDVGSVYEYEILETEMKLEAESKSKIETISDDKEDPKPRASKRGRPRTKSLDDTSRAAKRAEVCTICGKFIKNLTEHMRIHNNERRHQCPYCAKSFVSASNYSSHVNIHTRAKMYKCDLCDKQYALLNSLKQHRITHFKERIYLCPVCGKAYYQPTGLARHKRTHFEQPTIKCTECDKMFLTNGDLRKHFKKHLPEKPFSCEICNRAFNRKDNLKTHMKTHREKGSKLSPCDEPEKQENTPIKIKLEITKV
ncbi:zinc finger protein 691-like [Armigeres subalbatus]|uniref:zinc finger protein 691-like n=1 Tax=Armigeres subalbatus TaxID=124917 RepID=UPI002ED0F9C4